MVELHTPAEGPEMDAGVWGMDDDTFLHLATLAPQLLSAVAHTGGELLYGAGKFTCIEFV